MAYPIDDTQDGTGTVDYANSPGPAAPVASTQLSPEETANIEMSPEDHSLLSAVAATPHPEIDMGAEDPGQTRQDWRTWALGRGTSDQTTPAPTSQGGSVKASIETHGLTDAGLKRSKALFSGSMPQTSHLSAALDAESQQNQSDLERGYATQKSAMDQMVGIHKTHLNELQDIHRAEYDASVKAGQLEEMATAQAKAHSDGYIAQYQQDMAGVKQLMMQTGNPLGGLDATGKLGLAGAMFAQGFLGARYGIKIDVAGQIDKWVDREMQYHQQAIANATDAAKSNLTLYNLARQGANDEWEARQRLRGFVADGLKAKTLMEADRFGSDSAKADALMKAGELDVAKTHIMIGLKQKVMDQQLNLYKDDIDAHYKMGMLGIEGYKAGAEARYHDAMAKAAGAKKEPEYVTFSDSETVPAHDPQDNPILGPGGKQLQVPANQWQVDKSDPQAMKIAYEARSKWANYKDGLDKVMKLRDEAYQDLENKGELRGNLDKIKKIGMRDSTKFQAYQAAKTKFVMDQIYKESGANFSKQELESKMDVEYPDAQIFGHNGGEVFVHMGEMGRQHFQRDMENVSHTTAQSEASPRAAQDYKNMVNGGAEQVSPIQREAGTAEEVTGLAGPSNSAYKDFLQQRKDAGKIGELSNFPREEQYAAHMDALANVALSNPADKAEAVAALARIAQHQYLPEERRQYAQYLIDNINSNPGGLSSKLNSEAPAGQRYK